MIYLNNATAPQNMVIVKNTTEALSGCVLTITSTVTRKVVVTVSDISLPASSSRYWTLGVSLPSGVNDGEYIYRITVGSKLQTEGVCYIGDVIRAQQQGNGAIEIKQARQ